jgi:hypothetical protein
LTFFNSAQTIVPFGVFAVSAVAGPVNAPEGACGFQSAAALVSPTIDVANAAATVSQIVLSAQVISPLGDLVGSSTIQSTLSPGGFARLLPPPIALSSAALWSPACTPDASIRPLYTLVTTLSDSNTGVILDSTNTTFGIRNATFDANKGLFINGFQAKMRGVSMHQDFAGVGTFVPPNVQNNGDHLNHLPGQGISSTPVYKGLARLIVRSGQSPTGAPLVVTMTSDGLVGTSIEIDVV